MKWGSDEMGTWEAEASWLRWLLSPFTQSPPPFPLISAYPSPPAAAENFDRHKSDSNKRGPLRDAIWADPARDMHITENKEPGKKKVRAVGCNRGCGDWMLSLLFFVVFF